MDSTREQTPGEKLLAVATPDIVEYIDEFLTKELGGHLVFDIHIDASGKLRKLIASPTLVRNYN